MTGPGGDSAARPARRDLPRTDPPTPADSRDVRARILDAAERVLAGRRFESLSVADILDAAGVSRGSFYFYFANKHAVLAELVRRAVASAREAAGTWAGDESGAPGSALRRGTREGSRLWREHAPVLQAIVENWQSDPALAALWTQTMDGFTAVAAERIQADRAAGLALDRGDDPWVLASVLCWMSERAWYLAAIGHAGFTDQDGLADTLTEVWQASIYGTPDGSDTPAGPPGA
jgi:TetR/AcrR family transcriptional regulator, ethionamide resistance regulator